MPEWITSNKWFTAAALVVFMVMGSLTMALLLATPSPVSGKSPPTPCDGTITTPGTNNLTVGSGENCIILGVTIRGNVVVTGSGTLEVTGAGSVQNIRAFDSAQIRLGPGVTVRTIRVVGSGFLDFAAAAGGFSTVRNVKLGGNVTLFASGSATDNRVFSNITCTENAAALGSSRSASDWDGDGDTDGTVKNYNCPTD